MFITISMRQVRIVLALLGATLFALPTHAQTNANTKTADSPPMSAYLGATVRDPLEVYYDNTLVCAAAKTGQDLCHLWLYRDGSFINFDGNAAHTGHYSVGPARADGKVPVCQYWDSADNVNPPELITPMGAPTNQPPENAQSGMEAGVPATSSPASTGASQGATPGGASSGDPGRGMYCKNENYQTTCYRGVDINTLSEADKKMTNLSMGERFYNGMCYPLGPHNVGDVWFEDDDPLPGQLGLDKLFLLPGRQ